MNLCIWDVVHTFMNKSISATPTYAPIERFTFTLHETRSIYDSMNIPKIEYITYIYILYYQSSINFQFSPNLACFPDILN